MARARAWSGVLIAGTALATSAGAAVDGERLARTGNEAGATACVTCHGQGGGGQAAAGFPFLAGLHRDYLIRQLQAFKTGARVNPVMQPIADALSSEEIEAVAEYYAGLPVPTQGLGEPAAPAATARARELMAEGKWQQAGMPACVACHGPGGGGVGGTFPLIVGQPAAYIKGQLEAWRQGRRTTDPNDLMKSVADKLAPEEIELLSTYLASQSPAAAAGGAPRADRGGEP